MRIVFIMVLLALVAACGGRPAKPVAQVRTTDAQLTCAHIKAEGQVNLARIQSLVGEGDMATAQNVAFLLVAPIAALPLFLARIIHRNGSLRLAVVA